MDSQPEEETGLEVGDLVIIQGGRLNKSSGKIYGFSQDRIDILPKGSTSSLIKIPLIDGSPDPEYEIENILILKKALRTGFINLVDLRAGQTVETFGSAGEPRGIFKVIRVDEEKDSATFQDESGEEENIVFGFTGIPRGSPYEVIRTREESVPEGEKQEGKEEEIQQAGPVSRVAVDEDDILQEGQAPSAEEERPLDFTIGQVIELPVEEELKETGTADRIYVDVFQRSEMLSQMIRLLPPIQQRDPLKLQEVRRNVEQMILLRNEVVKYGVTGDPAGIKATSINTLAELVTRPDVPLSRKVADMTKVLYLDYRKSFTFLGNPIFKEEDPDAGPLEEGLYAEYLIDIIKRAEVLQQSANETNAAQEVAVQMPKFYLDMEKYRQKIQAPFLLEAGKEAVSTDEEVFRREIPSFESPELNTLEVVGKHMKKSETAVLFNPPPIKQSPFAITRILKERVARFSKGEAIRAVETGENPSYTNVLVFPMTVLRDLGPIRSGILAQDMSLGAARPNSMERILEELGEITEFPTADSILNIGINGNILGNVFIKEWLANLRLNIGGLGDAWATLRGYGTKDIEWNLEQAQVLQDKIEQRLAGLRVFMGKQRELASSQLTNLKFEPQPVLAAQDSARLLSRIESEPLLQKVMTDIREYIGDLALVDINWFTYVFIEYPDLLLATLGQQPGILTRQRLRHVRILYTNARFAGYRLKRKLLDSGLPPEENACPHVERLMKVRKIEKSTEDEPRDVLKVKMLVKLLNDFRGRTEDDWIWCKVCDQHLICAHELIQIQEFLRPAEQETLHKEMIIKFSGGQFAGKFICRVCGRAIANLEFDQSLEFDDEGRPMMGRSVMVDRDSIALDELEELLKGPSEIIKGIEFGTETLDLMYLTLKKMAGLMGVNPEEREYRVMVEDLSTYLLSLPNREAYAQATRGKKVQDFDIYYSINYVSAAAAVLLLKIQTRVPDYIVYYTSSDCKEGFLGYPLEETEASQGINCIASVVAGINDNEFPWNMTTLQKQGNLLKRTDLIKPLIRKQIDAFVKHPTQQTLMKRKRDYRAKLAGTDKKVGGVFGVADQIAKSFRPVPFILSPEDSAKEVVVAPAASPEKQATAWIRMAHMIARKNAALNPDTPISETTCCLHKLTEPFPDLAKEAMPALEERRVSVGHKGTLNTTFYTERPKTLEGKIDPKDYFKLFVHLCYQGDNKGLPHNIGLTLSCLECGLNFKENPNLPLSTQADPKKAKEEESKASAELQAHIVSQGIIINEETAQDLLTTSRLRSHVVKDPVVPVPKMSNMLAELQEVPPMAGWASMLNSIQVVLAELGPSATRIQIAKASEDLVNSIIEKEEFIRIRLGDDVFRYIESLTRRSPRECGESVTACILVPFKRWISRIDVSKFKILASYELSKDTENDIMIKGLGNYLKTIGDDSELKGLALRKVRAFIDDLSRICKSVFPVLRSVLTPGGQLMTQYLLRAYVMGTIQKFLDPHEIPDVEVYGTDEDGPTEDEGGVVNMKALYRALAQSLTKYAVISKTPTEEEIRLSLEKRVEKEKQQFIGEMDRMSKDEKRVEKTLMSLGMGKWAAGGSKAIRQYDPERYETERAERAAAGIVDYAPEGGDRIMDMFGADFGADYDAGGDRMGGDYDEGGMAEDEY